MPSEARWSVRDLADLAASIRDHEQKTAISSIGRVAYLEGDPGREGGLDPGTKYVVIDGNSLLAVAREAGFTEIKVMLDDDTGSNPTKYWSRPSSPTFTARNRQLCSAGSVRTRPRSRRLTCDA
ncbi:hypothetical protein ACFU8W_49525 [Streptomyces sp. NPDC057565]|uniref:hypothetical protein n=1 Tax=Streptomyces sp. NPDC057565 TaxID=3346169 RepID=UPI003679B543